MIFVAVFIAWSHHGCESCGCLTEAIQTEEDQLWVQKLSSRLDNCMVTRWDKKLHLYAFVHISFEQGSVHSNSSYKGGTNSGNSWHMEFLSETKLKGCLHFVCLYDLYVCLFV